MMAKAKPDKRKRSAGAIRPPLLEAVKPANGFERWVPLVVVLLLGVVVYISILDNELVSWDDDIYLYDNPQLTNPKGFQDIWTNYKKTRYEAEGQQDTPHQFYPLTLTIIYLEHHVFHWLNDELLFTLPGDLRDQLDRPKVTEALRQEFAAHDISVPKTARIFPQKAGRRWVIADVHRLRKAKAGYGVRSESGKLNVYSSDPAVFDHKMEAPYFHAVSVVWNGINAMLMILLLRRLGLGVWTSWVVAALFVVNPMNAATVAWGAEQKNIFALFFYMLAFMCYLRHRRRGGWLSYVGVLLLFQCAMWSKTVAVTFPLVCFLTDRLLERGWGLASLFRSALRVAPMLLMALAAALLTVYTEDRDRDVPLTDFQRPFVAAASIWFCALKLLVPLKQLPIYQHWNPDPNNYAGWHPAAHLAWWLPIMGLAVVGWVLFHWRKKIPPHFFWGLGFYLVTQLPMMGWKNINFFQFAFVSDHYVYHGCAGVFVMIAVGLDVLRRKISNRIAGTPLVTALVCAALAAYGVKTSIYANVWQTADTFWNTTLAGNPGCWAGWYNLGNRCKRDAAAYRLRGDKAKAEECIEEAIGRYQGAIRAKPNLVHAYQQLLPLLISKKRYDEAEEYCGRVETHKPFLAHYFRGRRHAREKQWEKAAKSYQQALRCPSSKTERAEAAVVASDCMLRLRRWKEAISLYEHVLKLDCGKNERYKAHLGLGVAYLELGEPDQAEAHLVKALELRPGDPRAEVRLKKIRAQKQ